MFCAEWMWSVRVQTLVTLFVCCCGCRSSSSSSTLRSSLRLSRVWRIVRVSLRLLERQRDDVWLVFVMETMWQYVWKRERETNINKETDLRSQNLEWTNPSTTRNHSQAYRRRLLNPQTIKHACSCVCMEFVLCLQVLVEQLPLQPAARLPLLGQLPLGVTVLRLLPARLLLGLVQLTLQRADPLRHLEDHRAPG